jgi:methionine-rich copper-binding protein CopC
VALVASFGAVLGTAAPAAAHGQFVRSDPAAGTQVTAPLTAVYLYFTEKPTSNAFFAVTAPSGARVDRLWSHGPTAPIEPRIHEWYHQSDGLWVVRAYSTAYSAKVPIAYWPEVGDYKVQFVSVATDGQPVRGEFTFSYAGAVTPLPADYSPQGNEPDPNLLAVAPPGAPTAPPTGPPIEEIVAQAEAGPSLLILWIPLAIVAIVALAGMIYWRLRPERARELVVSRFGGRYAAPTQRRPPALPSGLAERIRRGGRVLSTRVAVPGSRPGVTAVKSETSEQSEPVDEAGPSEVKPAGTNEP